VEFPRSVGFKVLVKNNRALTGMTGFRAGWTDDSGARDRHELTGAFHTIRRRGRPA